MSISVDSYLTSEHPLSRMYCRASAVFGAALVAFGSAGIAELFRSARTELVLGNPDIAIIAMMLGSGLVLIAAAMRGGGSASTAMAAAGALLLPVGLIFVTVRIAAVGALAFQSPNGIFCVALGFVVLSTGSYGRFTGNLPDDNPWRQWRGARHRR